MVDASVDASTAQAKDGNAAAASWEEPTAVPYTFVACADLCRQDHSDYKYRKWSALWRRYFPRVLCMTLRECTDRHPQCLKEFHSVGLCHSLTFFVTERHPQGFRLGSFQSHRQCAREGVATGHGITVFEDDVKFDSDFTTTQLERVGKDFALLRQRNPDWQRLYLGHLGIRDVLPAAGTSTIYGTSSVVLIHAYVLSPTFTTRVANMTEKDIAMTDANRSGTLDIAFSTDKGSYMVSPAIILQRGEQTTREGDFIFDGPLQPLWLRVGEGLGIVAPLVPVLIAVVLATMVAG